jgi:hypothetical protein
MVYLRLIDGVERKMGALEKRFELRRIEVTLETMKNSGDLDGLYQMALQLNRWAWVMKEQSEFAMAQSLGIQLGR